MTNDMKKIFNRPKQWGLRGDPFLWEELKTKAIRKNNFSNVGEFREFIENSISEKIGMPLGPASNNVFIKEYEVNSGGMSNGVVCVQWWKDKGVPTLIKNFENN